MSTWAWHHDLSFWKLRLTHTEPPAQGTQARGGCREPGFRHRTPSCSCRTRAPLTVGLQQLSFLLSTSGNQKSKIKAFTGPGSFLPLPAPRLQVSLGLWPHHSVSLLFSCGLSPGSAYNTLFYLRTPSLEEGHPDQHGPLFAGLHPGGRISQ